MKACYKTLLAAGSAVLMLASMPMTGCTDVDDRLGSGLLPKDQETEVHTAVIRGLNTYLAKSDSIPTGRLGRMMIGRMESADFGKTECATVVQFVPGISNSLSTTNPYGYKPVVDSVELAMQIETIYGDPSVEQKFYIYRFEPTKPLHYDTLYYPSYNAEAAVDRSKPLFSFSLKNENKGSLVYKKLAVEAEGQRFIDELVGLDTMLYVQSDTVFRNIFKGLYIAPSNNPAEAPDNAAVYDISPFSYASSLLTQDLTYLIVHFHTHKKNPEPGDVRHMCEGEQRVLDTTLYVGYSFDDSGNFMHHPSTSVVTIKHDYTGSSVDVSKFVDPYDFDPATAQQVDPLYVQGGVGVSSYLHFDDKFMDELQELAWFRDSGGNKIEPAIVMLNKASLIFTLEDGADVEVLDNAIDRLGMYYAYKGTNPENIPDFLYKEEALYSDFTAPYGGYLNRAKQTYEMDISMYLKSLINDPDDVPRHVWLSPAVKTQFKLREVVIQNGREGASAIRQDDNIQLRLVYTLLKKR